MIGLFCLTVAKGQTVECEFLRLHEELNGDIFYTAHPSGQSETSFKLVKLTNGEAVFEIVPRFYMPAGELRIHDPDGYCLLVGQLD
jgi:hypothetical protein